MQGTEKEIDINQVNAADQNSKNSFLVYKKLFYKQVSDGWLTKQDRELLSRCEHNLEVHFNKLVP